MATDLISDGQELDPSFQPELLFDGNGFNEPNAPFGLSNVVVTPQANGSTSLAFQVLDELITRGESGQILGGMVNPAGGYTPSPGSGRRRGRSPSEP